MPIQLPTQSLRDVSSGIIQKVDNTVKPPNSVSLALNVVFDSVLGRAVLRKGTERVGDAIPGVGACTGLGQHITTAGVQVPLAAFAIGGGSDIYSYTNGSWASTLSGLSANRTRFCTFLDTTLAINDNVRATTLDGETWATSGGALDVGNMPAGKYALEFLDRILIAGVAANPDTLYRSSIPVAGSVSWTSGQSSLDIEREEGAGPITGLAKVPGYSLIFKQRSIKRWDNQSTYPESMMTIGAMSQEAIVQAKQSVFFYNPLRGIYETTGGLPRRVSRQVQEIVDAVPSVNYSAIAGGCDGELLYFRIGDVTLGGLSLTNCVLMYSIDDKSYSLLSFPQNFNLFARRVDDSGFETLMGGASGDGVWDVCQGIGDGEEQAPFPYLIEWTELEFGSRGLQKNLPRLVTYVKDLRNASISVRVDGEGKYGKIGAINKDIMEITRNFHARFLDIRIQGLGTSGHIIGIDFPNVEVNDTYHA